MLITEAELRELWRDGKSALPAFPKGTRFSPAAQDFLKAQQLEVRFQDAEPSATAQTNQDWNKPATFPVVFSGPVPVCNVCGQPLPHKPDHMTQLDAGHFAAKTHPRIKFRGQLDSLHAWVMLAAAEARRYQLPNLAEGLDTLAAYCREIQSAEYHGRTVQALTLNGKDEEEIRQISHHPDKHLGIAHLKPGPTDHSILHWLNVIRTQTRELELTALGIYGPQEHTHEDKEGPGSIPQALNRLSSAIYVLELWFKRGDLRWKV
jgi:ethanolamine utilization cobalamin adenosyltransferase